MLGRLFPFLLEKQGSLYYHQPKQCNMIGEIPQNHHTFALFDRPQIGNFMTPKKWLPFQGRNFGVKLQWFTAYPIHEILVGSWRGFPHAWNQNTPCVYHGWSTYPPPGHVTTPHKQGFNSRPYWGKLMVKPSPDHKAGYFWGGYVWQGRLTSHEYRCPEI